MLICLHSLFSFIWFHWWGPGEPCSKLTLKRTGFVQTEPYDCVAQSLPCPHSDYSPAVCFVWTKSSGSPLKTRWSIATTLSCLPQSSASSCFFLEPSPLGLLSKTQTNSQFWSGLCRVLRPGSLSFPLPAQSWRFLFPILCLRGRVSPCSEKNPGETGERKWPSFLRSFLDT